MTAECDDNSKKHGAFTSFYLQGKHDKFTVYLDSNLDSDFAKIFIYKETDERITSTFRIAIIRDVNIRERRMGGMEGSCHIVSVCYLQGHLLNLFWWTLITSEEHFVSLNSVKQRQCCFRRDEKCRQ